MTPEIELIRAALRFADWAAGEGICPADGDDAEAPEDFLMAYSVATGDEEWETLAERLIDALAKRLGEQGLEIIESAKSLAMNESALAEKDASIRAAERAVGRREGREEIARAMERLAHNRDREVAALREGAFKRASMGEAMAFREAARVARVLLTKEEADG